jgi:hypothetical protein
VVAATFPRERFSCGGCLTGCDPTPQQRSCPGADRNAVRSFYGGRFTWKGCPRAALNVRIEALLRWHERAKGAIPLHRLGRTSHLLVEAFEAIDHADALRAAEQRETEHRAFTRKAGG